MRDAEDGDDRIADELLHRSSVSLERGSRLLEVAGHEMSERLGVELLAQSRGAGDVGEQNSDDLASLDLSRAGRRLGWGRCATRSRRRRLGCPCEIECRVLSEHLAVEVPQGATGLDSEFLDERATPLLVGLERLCLAAGAIERQHQLTA